MSSRGTNHASLPHQECTPAQAEAHRAADTGIADGMAAAASGPAQLRVTEVSIAGRLRPKLSSDDAGSSAVQVQADANTISVKVPVGGKQRKLKRFVLDVAFPAECVASAPHAVLSCATAPRRPAQRHTSTSVQGSVWAQGV